MCLFKNHLHNPYLGILYEISYNNVESLRKLTFDLIKQSINVSKLRLLTNLTIPTVFNYNKKMDPLC